MSGKFWAGVLGGVFSGGVAGYFVSWANLHHGNLHQDVDNIILLIDSARKHADSYWTKGERDQGAERIIKRTLMDMTHSISALDKRTRFFYLADKRAPHELRRMVTGYPFEGVDMSPDTNRVHVIDARARELKTLIRDSLKIRNFFRVR